MASHKKFWEVEIDFEDKLHQSIYDTDKILATFGLFDGSKKVKKVRLQLILLETKGDKT